MTARAPATLAPVPLAPLARLPKSALAILYEAARHILRRPVVAVCAAARTPDGRWLLIRRADTGTWALPGGTLEWGETLASCLAREVLEEAGARVRAIGRVVGVYSRPDRDPRFHSVTIVVTCDVEEPHRAPLHAIEVLEVRAFADDETPRDLAMGQADMLDAARAGGPTVFE